MNQNTILAGDYIYDSLIMLKVVDFSKAFDLESLDGPMSIAM